MSTSRILKPATTYSAVMPRTPWCALAEGCLVSDSFLANATIRHQEGSSGAT